MFMNTPFQMSSKQTTWALNEVNFAFIPGQGMTYHLARLDNNLGNKIAFLLKEVGINIVYNWGK